MRLPTLGLLGLNCFPGLMALTSLSFLQIFHLITIQRIRSVMAISTPSLTIAGTTAPGANIQPLPQQWLRLTFVGRHGLFSERGLYRTTPRVTVAQSLPRLNDAQRRPRLPGQPGLSSKSLRIADHRYAESSDCDGANDIGEGETCHVATNDMPQPLTSFSTHRRPILS
jgi:hypothetical protein